MARVLGGAVPLNFTHNECALPTNTGACLTESDKASQYIKSFLRENGDRNTYTLMSTKNMIEEVKSLLGVKTEAEIWEHRTFRKHTGAAVADRILQEKYKIHGPAHSTALLDNTNIDSTLEQWSMNSMKLFSRKFYHVPFQMIDFMEMKTELSCLDLGELIAKGYDCFGVVLNTDVSSGGGKHWFCLFGDFAHEGSKADPYTLEFFNSSGNMPMDAVAVWMENACYKLLKFHKKHCEIIRAVQRRLQNSQTECGVWSLLYIRMRLEGHSPTWFYTVKANDEDMIRARKLIFRE